MTAYSRKKHVFSTFVSLLLVLIALFSCFTLTACEFGTSNRLTGDNGVAIEGGGFKEGSVLKASFLDEESEAYDLTIDAIEGQDYDKTQPVYVLELSVEKDGAKIQPNGKVKVTVPFEKSLKNYFVLHLKDDGKIEKLSMTYKNGKATFQTNGFSKFAFVKKVSSSSDDGEKGDDSVKYTFLAESKTFMGTGDGGSVKDVNGEHIRNVEQKIAAGEQFTVQSHCYSHYVFLGWYDKSDDTLISADDFHTFTVNGNITVYALYAYETDVLKLTLDAYGAGFSYENGKPIVTLVAKDSTDVPNPKNVSVSAVLANGKIEDFNSEFASSFRENITLDDGGLDCSKTGTYTITYTYKHNETIRATLTVQVVEGGNTLKVSTDSDNLKFICNDSAKLRNFEAIIPAGKPVTLAAEPKDGYAFGGWYNESDDSPVSEDVVYCFKMPDHEVRLYGKYEASATSLYVTVPYSQGELADGFGNAYPYTWQNGTTRYFRKGTTVNLTVIARDSYDFTGWYKRNGEDYLFLTEKNTLSLIIDENKDVLAQFNEKIKSIEVDPDALTDAGFVDGKIVYTIGDVASDYKNFGVYANGVTGSYRKLAAEDYSIDDSAVNFNEAGAYPIVFAYRYNTEIKTEITIAVVDSNSPRIEFSKGYSYLDHDYNGKAAFVSLKDVKINGEPLYGFGADSKIWKKISYKWIDATTNKEVDATDADITINGKTVKKFGPKSAPMTVGNEFGGPIEAGSYRFEFIYDGETAFTQTAKISASAYKKITTRDEFKTNEGSSWINFELYYYTIAAYVDGDYYVMQMPSIGADNAANTEVEARKATLDKNGNIIVGEGNDFAFVNARYIASDSSDYTEFLTGYYGSYVDRSSRSTVDGTLFGSPYIYRTGYTTVSGGKIYREYGNKEYYGNIVQFAANGAVSVYSRYYNQTANNRLRLVKDGSRYVFTSIPEDTDPRTSYELFVFQSPIKQTDQSNNGK